MKVGIYFGEHGNLLEIVKELIESAGIEIYEEESSFLSDSSQLEGIDAVVCHPQRSNKNGKLDREREVNEKHPEKHFYISYSNKRYEVIGKQPNVTYLTDEIGTAFWDDPVTFLKARHE